MSFILTSAHDKSKEQILSGRSSPLKLGLREISSKLKQEREALIVKKEKHNAQHRKHGPIVVGRFS